MTKVLALDIGDKRIGVASGDTAVAIAFPSAVLERGGGRAETELLDIIKKDQITHLVVGLPLDASGRETPQCAKVRRFCERLQKRAVIEVTFVDEHLSSEDAKQRLSESRSGRAAVKTGVDAAAAAIILQSYFDGLKR